jgi:hypothetical protein
LTRLTPEQVNEHEAKDYQNASFDTVIEVAEALGIKLQHGIFVSIINDFLGKELTKVRQAQHANTPTQLAS